MGLHIVANGKLCYIKIYIYIYIYDVYKDTKDAIHAQERTFLWFYLYFAKIAQKLIICL